MKLFTIFNCVLLFFIPGMVLCAELPVSELEHQSVEQVRIIGNSSIATQTILEQVTLNVLPLSRATLEDIHSDLNSIYLLGYFQDVRVLLEQGIEGIVVSYIVTENPVIRTIRYDGPTVFSLGRLSRTIGSKEGSVMSYRQINEDITNLNNLYYNEGYSLSSVTTVNFIADENALVYRIHETRINKVSFAGNRKIGDYLMYREMDEKNNSVFNDIKLRRDRERILRLGYFSSVSPPQLTPDNGSVAIRFDVAERKFDSVGLSLKDAHPGVAALTNFNVNNIFNNAESYSGTFQVGGDQVYGLHYFQPWIGQNRLSLGLDSWVQIVADDFRSVGWDVVLGKPFSDFFKTFLTYKNEAVKLFGGERNSYSKKSLGLLISYDNRDNTAKTTAGTYISAQYDKGGPLWSIDLGGIDFTRASLIFSRFFPFDKYRQVLAMHTQLGMYKTSVTFDRDNQKFRVGGTYTVRGYYDTKDFEEGTYMAVANLEYRMDINDLFSWVIFYDLGEAFDYSFDAGRLETGLGAGLRVSTPLGPLRLDLATSRVNKFIFHFGLGEMF